MPPVRVVLPYIAAWLPFCLIYALLMSVHGGLAPAVALVSSVWNVTPAALLGIGAWQAGRQISWPRGRRGRAMAAHAALATLYAGAWTGWIVLSMMLFSSPSVVDAYLRDALGWQILSGAMLYGVIAGTGYAAHVNQQLHRQSAAAARADALRVSAEMQALRAQLNPHFLFNVLHSLSALARREPAAVERAVERLARMIGFVLNVNQSAQATVTLEEEWSFIRDYLELERLRLGDRLVVHEEVDPDALECVVPPLILQPLVENAVKHGIAPRASGGVLRLSAVLHEDVLVLAVKDDGGGAGAEAAQAGVGIGLRSVQQRLLALYPGRAEFEVVTAPHRGFHVQIRIPAECDALVLGRVPC